VKKKLLIFGTGGGAELAFKKIKKKKDIEIFGFVEFQKYYKKKLFLNLPVIKFENLNKSHVKNFLIIVHKNFDNLNQDRTNIYKIFKKKKFKFYSYIDPSLDLNFKVGENCFILSNQSICEDVKIGNNVVMWSHNHIGDRTIIKDNVWITSCVSIGGDCNIGEDTFIGMNATIAHDTKIEKKNLIGANSLITSNTKKFDTFIVKTTKKTNIKSTDFVKLYNLDEK